MEKAKECECECEYECECVRSSGEDRSMEENRRVETDEIR